jgi:hypothetical protein
MEEIGNAYNILVGKHDGKRPFVTPRHRCQDNIRMDLRETWYKDMDWMHLAQNTDQWRALVNTVINFRVT